MYSRFPLQLVYKQLCILNLIQEVPVKTNLDDLKMNTLSSRMAQRLSAENGIEIKRGSEQREETQ